MQNRLKELRKEKKLSLVAIEKQTGIKRSTFSDYENGKTEPKLATWQKLADFFDVPISYLQGTDNYSAKELKRLLQSQKNDELWSDIRQKAFEKANNDVPVIPDPTISILKKLLTNAQNGLLTDKQEELLDLFLAMIMSSDDHTEKWFALFTENIFNLLAVKDFGFVTPNGKNDLLQNYSNLIDEIIESREKDNS